MSANPAAEWSTVASMIFDSGRVGEVLGTQLEAEDFVRPDAKLLYATVVEFFYSDQTIDPLLVAERCKGKLGRLWEIPEEAVPDELMRRLLARDYGASVIEHAAITKRLSTARKLLSVAMKAQAAIGEGSLSPEEVAGSMSAEALAITGGTVARTELLSWMETGTEYAKHLAQLRLAREKGIELGVYTGLAFIDEYTKGIAPTELCFLGGAPGAGKSILAWCAAEGFAMRQMRKPASERVGTLVCSLEMGLIPSSTRLAQSITGIDGVRLREGDISEREHQFVLREWKAREGLPIHFNYASNFRLSQLRALIVEGIRRHNVGFVVIDHFRQIDPDRHIDSGIEADEVKVRFLKESIAKDLDVAVLCLAHTVKMTRADGIAARPRLGDLRGSGQIAANADFVGLLHRPARNLSDDEMLAVGAKESDSEMIWAKSRHTGEGTAYFTIDASTMTVGNR